MNIPIKYNDSNEEFNYDLSLQMRLDRYIHKHFNLACIIAQMCPIYLLGGCIRDLINANNPKDLDFVIVGKEHSDFIKLLIDNLNIEYRLNRFGGYKLNYNGMEIDLWLTDDLFSSIQYNVDGLFYDIKNNNLLSLTFDDFLKNGIKEVNKENNIDNGRIKKLQKFEKEFKQKN